MTDINSLEWVDESLTFNNPGERALCSIAISLKRLADHLAPAEDGHQPPLLWLGDVLRELKS